VIPARDQLWAVLSDYSPKTRARRKVVVLLQAAVDDSGKGEPPAFILAGFVLRVEEWVAFSDAWQAILDKPPKIAYFKMKEAASCTGEFSRFSTSQRDKRVQAFTSLILQYRPLAVRNVIPHGAYQATFRGKIAKQADYPYFLSYYAIIGVLLRYQYLQKWHADSGVDFVFDEQGKESILPQLAWQFAKQIVPAWAKPLIGARPTARDEKAFLPLQAADFLAWHSRRFYLEQSRGKDYHSPAWEALSGLACAEDVWDGERLQKIFQGVRASAALFEYDVPKPWRKTFKRIWREKFKQQ
jgi:Protein of unknown function (DUF3800)